MKVRRAACLVASLLLAGCGGGTSAPTATKAPTSGPLGDTWTWNGSNWSRVTGAGPPARFDSAMAFDEAHGVAILFGGSVLLDQFDDTWSWDGRAWSKLRPAHHPSARSGHTMAYDATRRQVILFGGGHGLGERAVVLDDTWAWDGSDWAQLSNQGPPPPPRYEWAMAFDPQVKEVILFGGSNLNTEYRNDTWAWDGTSWAEVATDTRPSPRRGASLGYDPVRKGLVLFGGDNLRPNAGPGESGIPTADTWARTATGWTQLSPTSSPPARSGGVLADDPRGNNMILFGGSACPFTNQTWAWDGADWKELHPASAPPVRVSTMIATDLNRRQVVLFGGLADTPCL